MRLRIEPGVGGRAELAPTSSVEAHTPVPRPATNAAPSPVACSSAERRTGTPSWSACTWHSKPLAAAPPSTDSAGSVTPASRVIRSTTSRTSKAIASRVARTMCARVVPRVMPMIVPRA